MTGQHNKVAVSVLAALKRLSVRLSATGVPAVLIAFAILEVLAARWVPTLEFIILTAAFTVVSLVLVISAAVTELRKNRPVRPVIRQIPNRHTELCNLARQFISYNRNVPMEILEALGRSEEKDDMVRVNDTSTIFQELPSGANK